MTAENENLPAPTKAAPTPVPVTIEGALNIWDPSHGNHLAAMSQHLAKSTLVPQHFQNNEANCFIGLLVAAELGLNPFVTLQNLYVVHGTPAFSSKFLIALANRSGIFEGPLHIEETGEGDDLVVTCSAVHKTTGKECSMSASMAMAKAEGWTKNAKYKSMPGVMLGYRAASLFVRRYCPEVTLMGMQAVEELDDINASGQAGPAPYAQPAGSASDALAGADKGKATKAADPAPPPEVATETREQLEKVVQAKADRKEAEAKPKSKSKASSSKKKTPAKAAEEKPPAETPPADDESNGDLF